MKGIAPYPRNGRHEPKEIPPDVREARKDLDDWCIDTKLGGQKMMAGLLMSHLHALYDLGDAGKAHHALAMLDRAWEQPRLFVSDNRTECNKDIRPVLECLICAVERDFKAELDRPRDGRVR